MSGRYKSRRRQIDRTNETDSNDDPPTIASTSLQPSTNKRRRKPSPNDDQVSSIKKKKKIKKNENSNDIPIEQEEMVRPNSYRIPLLDGRLESKKSLKRRLEKNIMEPVHECGCVEKVDQIIEGPVYTHMAATSSVKGMRKLVADRFGGKTSEIRIVQVRHAEMEGKTENGCPIAKWILRRSNKKEKILCIVRKRPNHKCATAYIAICIVIWDGIQPEQADDMYKYMTKVLPEYGEETSRGCAIGKTRVCTCQGIDEKTCGASYTFGCTYLLYFKACKFSKSHPDKVRRFKLSEKADGSSMEAKLEEKFHELADTVGPLLERMCPASYYNQTYSGNRAQSCRLGREPGGPFSGIAVCMDFSTHPHKDRNDMNNGCTAVVTMTNHRGLAKPKDEQFHVLPLCVLDSTDEEKESWVLNGSLEIVNAKPMKKRFRQERLVPCTKPVKRQVEMPIKAKKRTKKTISSKKTSPGQDDTRATSNERSKRQDVAIKKKMFVNKRTDDRHLFEDPQVGGVAIALPHGSVVFECAKRELHGTTALKNPNRRKPKRISVVFYQHMNLCFTGHGAEEVKKRMKAKADEEGSRRNTKKKAKGAKEVRKRKKVDEGKQVNTKKAKGRASQKKKESDAPPLRTSFADHGTEEVRKRKKKKKVDEGKERNTKKAKGRVSRKKKEQ